MTISQKTLVTVSLVMMSALSIGQDVLTPKWVAHGFVNPTEHPKYSADGSRLLVWRANNPYNGAYGELAVYDVASGRVLAHLDIDSSVTALTGATLSPDGKVLYYGTPAGLFSYAVDTQVQTALPASGASTGIGPRFLEVTPDGKTIGYILKDAVSGGDRVFLYGLDTKSVKKKFSITNSGSSNTTGGLKFLAGATKLVVSGPTIYGTDGTLIKGLKGPADDFAVSPDGTAIFATDASYTFNIAAYKAGDLSSVWSIRSPGGLTGGAVTSDGKALLFAGSTYNNGVYAWTVSGFSTVTGKALAGTVTAPMPVPIQTPYVTASPTSTQILIGPDAKEASSQVWTYDSTKGTGTIVGGFFEGNLTPVDTNFRAVSASVSGKATACVVTNEYHNSSFSVDGVMGAIRSVQSGQIVGQVPDGAILSPDGKYYALISGKGLAVYTPAGTQIDSTTAPTNIQDVQWFGSKKLVLSDRYNQVGYVFSFDGSTLTAGITINVNHGINRVRVAPDGSKAVFLDGYNANVFDLTTGKPYATISGETNSRGIFDAGFAASGRLGVCEVASTDGRTYRFPEFRVYSVSGTKPVLVRKLTYDAGFDVSFAVGGALSPDGGTVVLGHAGPGSTTDPRSTGSVRLYRVADGGVVKRWDNQYVPDTGQRYNAFGFAGDNSTVFWSVDGATVAAPVVAFQSSLTLNPTSVVGGTSSTATITVNPSQTTDTVFTLKSSSTNATVPTTVTLPAGSTTATFTVTTTSVDAATSAVITASALSVSASANLAVTPPTALTLSVSPNPLPGGTKGTGVVTLNGPAGPSGVTVTLTSKNPSIASVPATVTVPALATSASFDVTTIDPTADTSVEVDAAGLGLSAASTFTVSRSATIQLSFNVSSIKGGNAATLTVSLSKAAPKGGVVVTLNAGSSGLLTVPTSVTVPSGQTSVTVNVLTAPTLTDQTVTVTGTDPSGRTSSTTLVVQAPVVMAAYCPFATFTGKGTTYAVAILDGLAPNGYTIASTSSDPSVKITPTFSVRAGHSVAEITMTISAVKVTTTVTVTVGGKAFNLILLP